MKTKKEKINQLHKEGVSSREIAKMCTTTHQYVRLVIQQSTEVGMSNILKRKKKIQQLFQEGKTVYNYETDSIFVYGECDTDTITKIIERQIPYNKIEVKKQKDLRIWFILVVVVLIFLFTFRPS